MVPPHRSTHAATATPPSGAVTPGCAPSCYGYLGLYILGQIAEGGLMVGLAVAALGSRKLDAGAGRRLQLFSGAVMLGLLLLRPEWLF
jgi:hypothetical protein